MNQLKYPFVANNSVLDVVITFGYRPLSFGLRHLEIVFETLMFDPKYSYFNSS